MEKFEEFLTQKILGYLQKYVELSMIKCGLIQRSIKEGDQRESIIKVTGFIASLEFCLQENGYCEIFVDKLKKMSMKKKIG